MAHDRDVKTSGAAVTRGNRRDCNWQENRVNIEGYLHFIKG
jgi:hypothetical protein